MPSVVRLVFAVWAAALGGSAVAQTFPALAKVRANACVVRGTAGEFSPETGRLEAGTRVTVVSAEGNDWLAIQPPAGSISWVPWTLVEPQAKPGPDGKLAPPFNAVVSADDGAGIRAGAVGENKPLAVQRTRLPKGTVVQVIGAKVKVRVDGDEQEMSWYPIIAPPDDVRFVKRAEVDLGGPAPGAGFVVKAGGSTSKPLPGTPAETTPAASPTKGDFTLSVPTGGDRPHFSPPPGAAKPADWPNNHPLWREAEKARGSGDTKTARELYTKLAQEVSRDGAGQDLELANLCYDRIYNSLGGAKAADNGSGWRPSESGPVVKAAEPPKAARTAEGMLVSTNARLDGKWTIYLLTDEKRVVRHYVISGGADLDKHAGKWVEVSGTEVRPDSLRGDPVVVATDVKIK